MGHIIMGLVNHGYQEISKSSGIASDFQNSLLNSLFSGNLGPPVFGGLAVRVAVQPYGDSHKETAIRR
jgi:hypothetical protein